MSHLPTCRTRKELTGGIWVHYSLPDIECKDASHNGAYIQREAEGQ